MRGVAKGLYDFWSQFNIPVYPEIAVPDDASLPYITYDIRQPDWRGVTFYSARVWYRDTSFAAITDKVDEISSAIGEGARIVLDNGYIYLFKEDNFAQFQPFEDTGDGIKCVYLQMTMHVLA